MNIIRLLSVLLTLLSASTYADEIRPGYLSISADSELTYQIVLKLPMKGDRILSLYPEYPEDCTAILKHSFQDGRASTQYWQLECLESLQGRKISIPNLQTSSTDVYLRYQNVDSEYHYRLTARHSEQVLAKNQGNVWSTYTLLGVEHILLG
ncbi:MAG: hypothetical protein OQK03_13635, partial [Colwellia sp.]|nr:hypothetical protein [Colwellia sp.]